MLCDYTFMCPRRLFSSPMGSWLKCPRLQDTTFLSLFQLPEVYKQGKFSKIISLSSATASTTPLQDLPPPLPLLLDVPYLDLKRLFLCHLACSPRGLQTFTRKSTHLSRCACKYTIDFHSQVDSPLKTYLQMHRWLSLASQLTSQNVLANALLTFTRKSTHLSRHACKCTIDFHSQVNAPLKTCLKMHLWLSLTSHLIPFGPSRPPWAWFYSWHSTCSDTAHSPPGLGRTLRFPITLWCSHPALASMKLLTEAIHPAAQDTHCGLGFARGAVPARILPTVLRDWVALYAFLIFLWGKFLLNWASPCHQVPPY